VGSSAGACRGSRSQRRRRRLTKNKQVNKNTRRQVDTANADRQRVYLFSCLYVFPFPYYQTNGLPNRTNYGKLCDIHRDVLQDETSTIKV
jgi:hypothetical protein